MGRSNLGNETLEESRHALVACHLGQNLESSLWVLEVLVLNTRLDDVQGRGHDQGCSRTSNRGDKVLEPRRLVVVLELEEIFLGEGRSSEQLCAPSLISLNLPKLHVEYETYRKGTGGISCGCPAPAAVQAEALIGDNFKYASSSEGLRVCLALDLENVEGQQDDLADADQATSCGVQDSLARLLAKSRLEVRTVVLRQEVACNGLAAVLVYSLENL